MTILTQPLTAPSVQHLSNDQVMDATSISAVTQQLESIDSDIIGSVNSLITELKSTPQVVSVVIPPTSLAAGNIALLGNFRIPVGYTATVLNAIIAATPSQVVSLAVIASAGTYGTNGTGQGSITLVNTISEYSANGQFVPAGELIFKATSSATVRVTVSVSVLISLVLSAP